MGDHPSFLGTGLGSQALTVSYAGTSEAGEKRYDAWGEQRYTSGTTPTTFRYTGQRFEESLGIYYYGARWYDPALGRWLSPDTIVPDPYDPESYDRYAYVRNNPVNWVDPSGHKDEGPGEVLDPRQIEINQQARPHHCETITVNGKTCYLVPVGTWHITKYIYAKESDIAFEAKDPPNTYEMFGVSTTISVCGSNGSDCENVTLPFRFVYGLEGILMQGTGIMNNGQAIHVNSYSGSWTSGGYWTGNATFCWGYGGPGYQMEPYQYAAVGPSYQGGLYYVPQFGPNYMNLPGGGIINGLDSGENIIDGDMDVFVGTGLYSSFISAIPSNGLDIPVYQIICK